MLDKNDPGQIAYSDPGVGTLAPEQSSLIGKLTLWYEQAFGVGLKDNVALAYRYVMQHWRPGDAIYIFGFSRGAYTARAGRHVAAAGVDATRIGEPAALRRSAGSPASTLTSAARSPTTGSPRSR
jgi:uncharacterized protein (DUF2235 family)